MGYPPKPIIERILKRTKRVGSCLVWMGPLNIDGYGHINIRQYPHRVCRVMYELVYEPIPKGDCVCHTCDMRNCVEPEHLALGTTQENTMDRVRKGRSRNAQFRVQKIVRWQTET